MQMNWKGKIREIGPEKGNLLYFILRFVMWFFFSEKRQEASGSIPSRRRSLKYEELNEEAKVLFPEFSKNDVPVRFWVPEPVMDALNDFRFRASEPFTYMLRQILASHCYGIIAFQAMKQANPHIFKEGGSFYQSAKENPPPGKKRITTYFVPELGKNVKPIKLFIPTRLRDDLQLLADHVGLSLSNYLREIVISRLFGHGALPLRPQMLECFPTQDIEAWSIGLDVPLREIPEKERFGHHDVRAEDSWVDDD